MVAGLTDFIGNGRWFDVSFDIAAIGKGVSRCSSCCHIRQFYVRRPHNYTRVAKVLDLPAVPVPPWPNRVTKRQLVASAEVSKSGLAVEKHLWDRRPYDVTSKSQAERRNS